MGITALYKLPFPEATDPADVPVDMQELTTQLEVLRLLGSPASPALTVTPIWRLIGGSSVVTTNSSGDATIFYGATYTNVQAVIVCQGDVSVGVKIVSLVAAPLVSGFNVHVASPAGANFVGSVRISWLALVA